MPEKFFDGKIFNFYGVRSTKKEAKAVADKLRKKFWLVRVVPYDSEWAIYRRKKR